MRNPFRRTKTVYLLKTGTVPRVADDAFASEDDVLTYLGLEHFDVLDKTESGRMTVYRVRDMLSDREMVFRVLHVRVLANTPTLIVPVLNAPWETR
ncbi:hypothetical protein ABZ215_24855 [Amycolatopsis sp. NPDC006131]|uniref:hypothetical protein n=1 Tax=Amycolatopsis sp. NPDC006131 TaxID=3156731 RepID=UPI0033B3E359